MNDELLKQYAAKSLEFANAIQGLWDLMQLRDYSPVGDAKFQQQIATCRRIKDDVIALEMQMDEFTSSYKETHHVR